MRRMKKMFMGSVLAVSMMIAMCGCGDKKEEAITTEMKTETTQATTTEEMVEASDFTFTLTGGNSWENGGYFCEQFDGIIKNQTNTNGKDWKVELVVPEGSKLESSWNGEYSLSGTSLTITAVDYNQEIASKGEINFGFILDTKEKYTPKGNITIGGNVYAVNDVETNSSTASEEEKKKEEKKEDKKVAAKDTSGTPFANHGKLSVKGTDLVDKNGEIYQLKGVSTHGLAWFPDYVNKEAFSDLAGYGVNAMRFAIYTEESGGYCSGGNKEQLKQLIDEGVTACDELGMYVVIDWHVLHDLDPTKYMEEAEVFFDEMSKKYSDHENIIYEICNEPNGGTTWETVKSYAETIIPIIRKNNKDAIIIVGTPTWSQDVDIASENPIENQKNVMYAVHFYATDHKQEIRDKVTKARDNGIAVIISECSICEASGNGSINYDEAQAWKDMIEEDNLSFFAWNLSNKDEQSSLIKSSVSKTSGFTEEDFSETGKWFMDLWGK